MVKETHNRLEGNRLNTQLLYELENCRLKDSQYRDLIYTGNLHSTRPMMFSILNPIVNIRGFKLYCTAFTYKCCGATDITIVSV